MALTKRHREDAQMKSFFIGLLVFVILMAHTIAAHRSGWNSGIKCMEDANGNTERISQCKDQPQ